MCRSRSAEDPTRERVARVELARDQEVKNLAKKSVDFNDGKIDGP
jgi:hypothetical protein